MTATVTKGLILRQDQKLWDGKTLGATRVDSTAGTILGVAVGNTVDVYSVYGGGTTATSGVIQDAVNSVGSNEVTFEFAPRIWTLTTSVTVPANISVILPSGCQFAIANGITLTFEGRYQARGVDHSSGLGTLIFTGPRVGYTYIYEVESFADGVIDATNFQAALDAANTAGGGYVRVSTPGTHTINATLTVGSNTTVEIMAGVTLQLAANTDAIFFENKDTAAGNSNIGFTGTGTLDGNKAAQSILSGTSNFHIIFLKFCDHSFVENLYFKDAGDNAIQFRGDGTKEGNMIRYVDVENSEGSGISINTVFNFIVDQVKSRNNGGGGIRVNGRGLFIYGGEFTGNNSGGLYQDTTGVGAQRLFIFGGLYAKNTGQEGSHGIVLLGVDHAGIYDVICEENDGSGLQMKNGATDIHIVGGTFRDNGQHATARSAEQGKDGITLIDPGGAVERVTISGVKCYDSQTGSETQDYGIAIDGNATDVLVTGCDLRGPHETGPMLVDLAGTGQNVRIDPSNVGLNYIFDDNSNNVTGTTVETDIFTTTLVADELGIGSGIRFIAVGEISGTAGTKKIDILIGTDETDDVVDQAAGDIKDWRIEVEIRRINDTDQTISVMAWEATTLTTNRVSNISEDFQSAITIKITGQLGDGADSILGRYFVMRPFM